jgi:hypothetical protein
MKKWLAGLFLILICLLGADYLFIPNSIQIDCSVPVVSNRDALYKNLSDEKNWRKWWPLDKNSHDSSSANELFYDDVLYSIGDRTELSIAVLIHGSPDVGTLLTVINKNPDSSILNWQASLTTTYNPLKRLQIYFKAKKTRNDLQFLLDKMQSFFSETKNVYGYDIHKELVKDSILLSTYGVSDGYPTTKFIYDLIDDLKKYTASQSARETGFPMLNIHTEDSVKYLTRVAIPVDKKMPRSGNISYKWMLGGGNILVTEAKGGPFSINKAFQQLENYVQDHRRTSPAIPFQSLVTDRRKQPDTTQWITKLYYPVM